jgi:hypothetical protein
VRITKRDGRVFEGDVVLDPEPHGKTTQWWAMPPEDYRLESGDSGAVDLLPPMTTIVFALTLPPGVEPQGFWAVEGGEIV